MEWFEKGIKYVKDFFINGFFMSLEHLLHVKYEKRNFQEYKSIKRKIHKMQVHCQIDGTTGLISPIMLDQITLKGKGCNIIYNIIQQTSENGRNGISLKWENILNDDVNLDDLIVHLRSNCFFKLKIVKTDMLILWKHLGLNVSCTN